MFSTQAVFIDIIQGTVLHVGGELACYTIFVIFFADFDFFYTLRALRPRSVIFNTLLTLREVARIARLIYIGK